MKDADKRQMLMKKIETHLRKTARQLVRFDTLDETLHYLGDSFWRNFSCDYICVILKKDQYLEVKMEKGEDCHFSDTFPLHWESCSPRFLTEALAYFNEHEEDVQCTFLKSLRNEGFPTWFSVPIKETDSSSLGVCVIAYRNAVPLLSNGDRLFEEFSKDLAAAITMAVQKENDKKKIKGMEWLKENLYLGASIDRLIENVVERAGKGTDAESASVFLFDEVNNCFVFQPPSYGPIQSPDKIQIYGNYNLFHSFPFLDKDGGREISVPLTVNLKTIGVIHVTKTATGVFTLEDLDLLQFLSSYVSVLIENARLYRSQSEYKARLEKLMIDHQELVEKTLPGEDFQEITNTLSRIINRTVLLMDRFFRSISYTLAGADQVDLAQILDLLDLQKWKVMNIKNQEQWIETGEREEFCIWKVLGGGNLLGYLCIKLRKKDLDMVLRMTINHSLNVYAIQFIKQKLVLDVKEQVKDSFINQLFVEHIEDRNKLIQYSNIINLNIHEPNQIAVLCLEFNKETNKETDLLDQETKKSWIWELIREDLFEREPEISLSYKEGYFIFIVPEKKIKEKDHFWEDIYHRIKKIVLVELQGVEVYLGISQSAQSMEDYFSCYKQALQAIKILMNNNVFHKGYLAYDNCGAYTVLNNLQDTFSAKLFLDKYINPLLNHSSSKNKDLFNTLRVYLQMNGNLKDTAEQLFLHRNSLKYRIEKVREILKLDIDNAEVRFYLMLAYTLYDLYGVKK